MLTDEQIFALRDSHAQHLSWGVLDFARAIESAASADRDKRIAELERQLEEVRKDAKPCPTCESLARAVMLDQAGKA